MKLSKEMRRAAGLTQVGKVLRPKLEPAVAGFVTMTLKGDPPKVTHHAKKLAPRGDWKRGRGKMTLVDSPELEAARQWLDHRIRETRTPVAGPIIAFVTWWFEARTPADVPGEDWQHKPDRDNLAKALFDVLAARGWIQQDEQVTDGPLRKLTAAKGEGRIELHLRTKLPGDLCSHFYPGEGRGEGQLHAYTAADRIELTIGTPGGVRKPPNRGKGPRSRKVVLPPRASRNGAATPRTSHRPMTTAS